MNIDEIAKKVHVSRATVSRVINKFPGVKEETRLLVQAAIDESNYIPSAAARSLASKRSQIIGVLVSNITQPFWSGIISGIEDCVSKTEYGLFLTNSHSLLSHWDYNKEYKRNLRDLVLRGVDGIITSMSTDISMEDVELLEKAEIPFVVIQSNLVDSRVASVNVNNVQGAYTATKYLIDLGHRSIIHASGPLDSAIYRDRTRGFMDAMQDSRLPVDNSSIVPCGSMFTDGYWVMKRLLALKEIPTAIVFSNDNTAYGACLAAREENIPVPDFISIAGFDGLANELDVARLLPDLTTMSQPVVKIGTTAAQMLLRQLGTVCGEMPPDLSLSLHKGSTCGPPRISG